MPKIRDCAAALLCKWPIIAVVVSTLFSAGPLASQTRIMPFAHAHNDYRHHRPLTNALDYGFCSVEADVHLSGSELYLGHLRPRKSQKRTLEYRYLDPLNQLLFYNNGSVYPGYKGVFYLMIDIKTEGNATYAALDNLLTNFPLLKNSPRVVIFLSGNRPLEAIRRDTSRYVGVDGRPSDLGKGFAADFMPVISDSYKNHFTWNGTGIMPLTEFEKLKSMAAQAHAEGKKFRLWAIPDRPEVWQTLLDAGVDFINTDKLREFNQYMQNR